MMVSPPSGVESAQEAYTQAAYALDRRQAVPIVSTMDRPQTFGESLAEALRPVIEPQHIAETAVAEFARGEEGAIHETMLALKRADISARLFVTTRNVCLGAFKEILQMGG